jgi:hypothetical protein
VDGEVAHRRDERSKAMATETTIIRISITDDTERIIIGAGNGDPCDLDATLAAYVEEVTDALRAEFPGAAVDYRWEPTTCGAKIEIEGEYPEEEYCEIKHSVQRVLEDIYERASFWVPAA